MTATAGAARTDRPFWAEKSAFVEGDELFVVGVASKVATLEEGRQQAFEHGKIELMNFAQVTDLEAQGLVIETQMTYEETNPDGTVNVFRLLRVPVERLQEIQGRLRKQSSVQSQAIDQERRALIRLQQSLVHKHQDLETRTRSVEHGLAQLNQQGQPALEQATGSGTRSEESNTLYLCDDGQAVLLTDNASLGCPVYEPQAQLITVRDGSSWADVEWAVAASDPEAFQPRDRPNRVTQPETARRNFCERWIDLNQKTDGAIDMGDTANTQEWLALSRIVTATNLCEEYLARPAYPRMK